MSELEVTRTRKSGANSRKIPRKMLAVRLHSAGGPVGIVYEEIETPRPGVGEALVRVHAAAVTRDELDWPVNRLPAIPSYEFSGTVTALGPGVKAVRVGQEVFALSPFDRNGAAAEYVAVPEECLAPKPRTLSHIEAASLPLSALTAWQGLLEHGQLTKGQRVLIHGATGGVGLFAVQLARLHDAYVMGTASSGSVEAAQALGLDKVINYTVKRFEDLVGEVDLVFDTAGGERLERSAAAIRRGGRLVSIATEPPQRSADERGITAIYFVVKPNAEQLTHIAALADNGSLKPIVDQVFPLGEAQQAFKRSLQRHSIGKIVLRVAEE